MNCLRYFDGLLPRMVEIHHLGSCTGARRHESLLAQKGDYWELCESQFQKGAKNIPVFT